MDIGINTLVDLDVPFNELLALISAAGFNHVSLSHDVAHAGYHLPEGRERIARLLDENGLKLDYIHMPLEDYHDLSSADNQTRKVSVETVKLALLACSELGGNCVVIHACGRRSLEDNQLAAAIEAATASAKELLEFASPLSAAVCLENLTANHDWQKVTLSLMNDPGLSGLTLCLDPCHAMIANDDPLALVKQMARRVTTTHLSDTMGEHDSHLIPGEGMVDFNAVARELGQAGFCGVVDLECSLWMQRLRKAKNQTHPGDSLPCSTGHYLQKAAAAAKQIASNIQQARNSH